MQDYRLTRLVRLVFLNQCAGDRENYLWQVPSTNPIDRLALKYKKHPTDRRRMVFLRPSLKSSFDNKAFCSLLPVTMRSAALYS